VKRHFYVDNGLISTTAEEAKDLLTGAHQMLAESHLRLHKEASNKERVMEALPLEDLERM